ncbi:sigma-70 family RNA polymerase sigma factor [Pontibacter sp. KCTC 32443]|uniref:RNA polymerase sigma factor n=1 Tax=Pontibacter TaxID=323449 RepID=UPI00164E3069|nr:MULTISPECIES: sigma-70 family RNA polymerase sigma factor [Pontibacter]MBC5775907.1 sigma-70 family RNA polymerase sigma factor [Pontibacter sp. KCTC 32443]
MNTTTQMSDSALVSLYISGNENAFEQLVNRHKNKVFTTIILIVKDTYTAEDLMQDAFIKAIHTMKSGRYNEEGKFSSWICRIAHNLAIDFFRKEKRSPMITLEDGSNVFNTLAFAADSAESLQIQEDTVARLRELIQTLPQSQREVLMMRHYADMSFQEIADATGVSINTALGRMRYALINLRKKMLNGNIAYDKNIYSE